jgi:hypothetical protein
MQMMHARRLCMKPETHLRRLLRIHTRKAAELDRAQAHGLKYGEAVAQAMY